MKRRYEQGVPVAYDSGGVVAVVVVSILLFSIAVVFFSSNLLGGILLFIFGVPLGILASNGGLVSMWYGYLDAKTERERDKLKVRLLGEHRPPAHPQLPYTRNFVSPYPEEDEQ